MAEKDVVTKEKTESKSEPQQPQMVPIEQVETLVERAATIATDKVLRVISDNNPKPLSEEAEKAMSEHAEDESGKEKMRKTLSGLPAEAQVIWTSAYYKAVDGHGLQTAWAAVKEQFKKVGEEWKSFRGANVEAIENSDSYIVYHKNLRLPATFASKREAYDFAISISADEVPGVKWSEEKKTYEVTHKDWTEPVEVKTVAEVQEVVERKLKDVGHDESSAKEHGEALVGKVGAKERENMSGSVVKADSAQVVPGSPDKPLVKGVGVPTDKISQPKEGFPKVPGYVTTEKPAIETIEKGKKDSGSMQQSHTGDYAKMAKRSDAEIEKLNRQRGLVTEVGKLASTEKGLKVVERFVAAAKISLYAAEIGEEGRKALATKYKKGEAGFDMSACISDLKGESGIDDPAALCQHLKQSYVV